MFRFSSDLASLSDHRLCRESTRHGSHSFFAASRLLPPKARRRAFALYAFCRLSDDAVDLQGGAHGAVDRLRERLLRAAQRRPLPAPADRAISDLMRDCAIDPALPGALLEGLQWDAQGRVYETFDDLLAYAARVAGSVGVMMALIMGARSPEALARASDLGLAMQLTNIARDIGEDARIGRLYLPRQWLREAGVDAQAWLAAPAHDPVIASLVARLLEEAAALYRRAECGVALLPASCRPAILAASLIYADIGREIARAGFDSVTRRARVSRSRKLELMARAVLRAPRLVAGEPQAPAPAAEFLLAAAPDTLNQRARLEIARRPRSLVAVLATFERLERSDRFGR